jgi:hypothetical protein
MDDDRDGGASLDNDTSLGNPRGMASNRTNVASIELAVVADAALLTSFDIT